MKLTFLGTGSMVPTAKRNHTSLFLEYRDEGILIDCGEGTQRQLRKARIKPRKITKVLITHWHGDHTLGLPGLIQTLAGNEYSKVLEIYGPKGTKEKIQSLLKIFYTDKLKMEIHEVKQGKILETDKYIIEAKKLDHKPLCFGYSFTEKDRRRINTKYIAKYGLKSHPILKKLVAGEDITWEDKKITAKKATYIVEGKKVVFLFDTAYENDLYKFAKDAEVLVMESTYGKEFEEDAKKRHHMTTVGAAKIAKKAKVKKLILTHFSQRYKDVTPLIKEAKKVFKNTEAAEDFKHLLL